VEAPRTPQENPQLMLHKIIQVIVYTILIPSKALQSLNEILTDTGVYPGFFLGGAQNPFFLFFTIFSLLLAIFPDLALDMPL